MNSLLELRGLSVHYGNVSAVERVDVSLEEGEAVALLGANGAGKTTILRAVGRLLRFHGGQVTEGEILLDGRPLRNQTPAQLVEAGVGQCLEGRHIFADLTVRDNLRLGAHTRRSRSGANARYDQMMELFPRLQDREQSRGALLSGGEQQMLAIARALMSAPRLLLLDEPSLGLAPLVVAEIGAILRRIRHDGTSILLVDQTTVLPAAVTDRAYLIETGCVRRTGLTADLLADGSVLESYLGLGSETAR